MNNVVKVVLAKAKLTGRESDIEISAMLMSQHALRENGFIRNSIVLNTSGIPDYICSLWKISKFDSGNPAELSRGQRYAYILESELLEASNPNN